MIRIGLASDLFGSGSADLWDSPFTLTATTTVSPQTVTITRLTYSRPSVIDWGDGSAYETIAAGSVAALTHDYATAGTYTIRAAKAQYITQIELDNAVLGGLDTAELRYSLVTYFLVTAITGSTIDSANMVDWRPTSWYLYSMPAGTYAIDSADMVDWRPLGWYLYSMPAGTYAIDSADMVDWRPTHWRMYSMPAAGSSYAFAAACMRNWTTIRDIRCQDLALVVAVVDVIVNDIWSGKATVSYATPSLNIGGTNDKAQEVF